MGVLLVLTIAVAALHLAWIAKRRGDVPVHVVVIDLVLALAVAALLRAGAAWLLDLAWWKELGEADTFWRLVAVDWVPSAVAALIGAVIFLAIFESARRRCASPLSRSLGFTAAGAITAAVVGLFLSLGAVDSWTSAQWWVAKPIPGYVDPLFHLDLSFYFFRLPFYRMILGWAVTLSLFGIAGYILTLLAGTSSISFMPTPDEPLRIQPPPRILDCVSMAVRGGAAWLLVLYAVSAVLARYGLLYSQHSFLYGADYVDTKLGVPLCWAQAVGALVLIALISTAPRRRFLFDEGLGVIEAIAGAMPPAAWVTVLGLLAFTWIAPSVIETLVRGLYVRPNELTLERPYIENHIASTLAAFNLSQSASEEPFIPRDTQTLDLTHQTDVSNNIRLWGYSPFGDNVTQRQTLRPYYGFPEVDTDRYDINGHRRQVLIAARSLQTDLLPDNAKTWVNLNLQYTHGYGAVAAVVNSATDEGAPDMVLKDAPPITDVSTLKITRPQLYFGPNTNRPVFVDSDQPEFDYPKGDDNAYTTYHGTGGIPMGTLGMRVVAAVARDDWNILLTRYLTKDSKLLIYRQIVQRVQRLAPFLTLDPDPYLVIDGSGHLVWMLDGYTQTGLHPYSQPVDIGGPVNYIRNSVKITVDAYNGDVHFYVFDEKDLLLKTYRDLFPRFFQPRSSMPADLQAHIRYPELIFSAQAETYRTFHMRDPQVFYNKEDQWDVAKQVLTAGEMRFTRPYYAMLPLPGDQKAEFALMLPFTAHNRDNLIAWIAARCDPDHYGEIIFYRLPKEKLIYGPLQVQSLIDQDSNISKDLSLWNQQGSSVVRGSTLVLPVDGTFLYVEPIYIQSAHAGMPELKKVVLGVGSRLVYTDDLPQAIAALAQAPSPEQASVAPPSAVAPPDLAGPMPKGNASLISSLRVHLQRYKELTAEGKLSQAGQELNALEQELENK